MLASECSVCGHRRKFKNLTYDQQLKAYCALPSQCHAGHPNSLKTCHARGTFIHLMTYEEAQIFSLRRSGANYEQISKDHGHKVKDVNLTRLTSGGVSFRLRSDIHATYITHVMGTLGVSEVTKAMAYILDFAIKNDSAFLAQNSGRQVAYQNIANPVTPFEPEKQAKVYAPQIPTREVENDEGEFVL